MSRMQWQSAHKGLAAHRFVSSASLFPKPKVAPPAPSILDAYIKKFRAQTSSPEYLSKLKALPKTRPLDLS